MNPEEAEKSINNEVRVTHTDVIVAKSYIMKNFVDDIESLRTRFLAALEAQLPKEVILHESVPLEPQSTQAAKSIISSLAFAEAIWGLVNSNILLLSHNHLSEINFSIGWTTVVPGSGGNSSGWQFERYKVVVPSKVRVAPSCEHPNQYALSDGDLYIKELDIEDLHVEVDEALRQAVKCFRHELYIPCVTMLARVAEGAWTELG